MQSTLVTSYPAAEATAPTTPLAPARTENLHLQPPQGDLASCEQVALAAEKFLLPYKLQNKTGRCHKGSDRFRRTAITSQILKTV
jgi:hypothetical protein